MRKLSGVATLTAELTATTRRRRRFPWTRRQERDHQVPGLTTASDEFLVKTAQNGGHSAYVELCRRCREWMFCVVQRITKNSHDTEDVLQDAWMRGFVHI
jgi:hypothetical protein